MLGADRTEISLEYQSPADGSSVARSGDRDFGTSRLEGGLQEATAVQWLRRGVKKGRSRRSFQDVKRARYN